MDGDLCDRQNELGLTPLEGVEEKTNVMLCAALPYEDSDYEIVTAEYVLKQVVNDETVEGLSVCDYIMQRMFGIY
ncbi:hypothetical protein GYMLUDRAFT_43941, partial [Collybiopsis luxurians FD-317 M1]